ncbi:MAG: 50S ribosomal protein L35 [Candidatus Margulisiibacteriota bacterium]|nr:MAG: 50S ribosomal protein L35 [Candidatus Margulisbacteria bacterium GWD2_39_127]OGI05479.1 MAG: 50S ribosomal protein L35 [Candidatus Margulisbacteria bacterium GWF2_38_17]OGI08323.1 MAG: 50S ribosomal protein L35 [Candidatus Margulisbacteria bacterium GWE2_39_32]PZM82319.1 MAG: 50S ribosomal protein L35 [Candidatus Margulisiibacteriota bacterium]HAR62935.1 50S ribosomal protein L35 [Candidatus Margulisiibacteriota bacterium]
MPKLKTRKAAAKRFKVTGSGKFMRRKQGSKHLLSHESSKLKRSRHGDVVISGADEKKVKNMLPYL